MSDWTRTRAMYFPDENILRKAIFLTWRHVLTLIEVATVSVPIVAETCCTQRSWVFAISPARSW